MAKRSLLKSQIKIMKSKLLLIICVFLSGGNLYALDDNDFDFSDENIPESQLKIIEIFFPDTRSKGILDNGYVETCVIKIGTDGIIRSIKSSEQVFLNIHRKGNLLKINGSDKRLWINNIKWDNDNVYARGLLGTYHSPDNSFTRIRIQTEKYTICDSPIMRLTKMSNEALLGQNKTNGPSIVYMNNITAQYYSNGFKFQKLIYLPNKNEINAVFYGGLDGAVEYSPPVKIKTNSINLYAGDMAINVINYLVLKSYNTGIADALFPLLFLEKPFVEKTGWVYTASSFLVEGGTLYSPNNLGKEEDLPWASSNGYGLNDKITIDMGASPSGKIKIINGFVSAKRPDLFFSNSRANQIKITNIDENLNKTVNLQDSKTPQVIDISELGIQENTLLEIEIISIYPGSKYKDLCIQAILPDTQR